MIWVQNHKDRIMIIDGYSKVDWICRCHVKAKWPLHVSWNMKNSSHQDTLVHDQVAHELYQIPEFKLTEICFWVAVSRTPLAHTWVREYASVLYARYCVYWEHPHDCSNTNSEALLESRATRIQDDICLANASHRLALDVQIRSA